MGREHRAGWGRRWRVVACLAALAAACLLPTPAVADSFVIDRAAAGEGGLQADALVVSPRPLPPATATGPVSDLTVAPPLPLQVPGPGQIERLQLYPWPPRQGQVLLVRLRASPGVTASLNFDGQAYPVHSEGWSAWALLPLPPLAEPGPHDLLVTSGGRSLALAVPVQAGDFPSDAIPAAVSDPILSDTARVQKEAQLVSGLFASASQVGWNPASRFRFPLDVAARHTSPFGSRRVYGSGAVSVHAGEDLAAGAGTPVLAPAAGTVVLAEKLLVRGNAVILDHGSGVYTGYWHMQALTVEAGERVTAGQELGEMGSTGLSTGSHLHWEMRVAGVAVDPLQWLAP